MLSKAAMPTLMLMNEAGEYRRVPLIDAQTKVGRSAVNHIVVESRRVSRLHAVFVLQGSFVTVRDLGSTNGTYVNNERVTVSPLFSGDTVRVGDVEIHFLDGAEAEAEIEETPLWISTGPAPELVDDIIPPVLAEGQKHEQAETHQGLLDGLQPAYDQISQLPVGGTRGAAWIGDALSFTFAAQGRPVNALITYEALADHFGDGAFSIDSESRAIEAYQRHSLAINVAASLRYAEIQREPVLLRTIHF